METTRLIIIRHCEAIGNSERVFNGHFDSDISEIGKRQALCLAERMKDESIDKLYSSPLIRAVKTAEAITKYHDLEVQINPSFKEINAGKWEGVKLDEISTSYSDLFSVWRYEPWNFKSSGGETMRDVFKRVNSGIDEVLREDMGKTICVVSHGAAIRCLMCRFKGYDIERLNEVKWSYNTGVSTVEFDDEMNANVVLEGDLSHLPDELTQGFKLHWQDEKRV